MKMLGALINLNPVCFTKIIKHPVKKVMLAHPYHCCVMRPHQDIGVIAADNTLGANDICDFVDIFFFMNPCREFHTRRKART